MAYFPKLSPQQPVYRPESPRSELSAFELNITLSSNFSETRVYLGPWSHQDLSVRESRASKEQVEGTRLGESEERDVAVGKLGTGIFPTCWTSEKHPSWRAGLAPGLRALL